MEQFAAEWGIGRYMLSKCWVLRWERRVPSTTSSMFHGCGLSEEQKLERRPLKSVRSSCLLSLASGFHAFGLEVCFYQKQLRRDQPLGGHSRQTHARYGEDGCYGRRRIMQLGARLFDGEIQLGRDRARICGRL